MSEQEMDSSSVVPTETANGQASGSEEPNGQASGSQVPNSEASGSQVANGEASGSQVPNGEASGSQLANGEASGSQVPNGQASGSQVPNGPEGANKVSVDSGVETSNDSNDSAAAQSGSNSQNATMPHFDINWIDTLLYYRALPPGETLTPLAQTNETRCPIEEIGQPGSSLSADAAGAASKPEVLPTRCSNPSCKGGACHKNSRTQEFLAICSNLSATFESSAVHMMKTQMRYNRRNHRKQPYVCRAKEKERNGDDWPYYHWSKSATVIKAREAKLCFAVTTNNVQRARRLLIMGVSPNCLDKEGFTPLHIASRRGFPEIVSLLLEYGADARSRNCTGETPLHVAVSAGHISVVTILLAAGTSPLSVDNLGYNVLDVAIMRLQLLQYCKSEDTATVKNEASKITNVLLACMKNRQGWNQQVEVLSNIASRLSLTNTANELHGELKDLLSKIGELHLER